MRPPLAVRAAIFVLAVAWFAWTNYVEYSTPPRVRGPCS